MTSTFRSVEFWKSALMTLPENAFFELLRCIFGRIKTPFSKQALLGDLEKFLTRDDIQRNIARYIDRHDACVIAAVAALNEPASGILESFFSGELSYTELHDLVVNLEERFIFYRFLEDGQGRLALNPLLEPVLAPIIADNSLLLPSVPVDEVTQSETSGRKAAMIDDRILAGLFSFVSENEVFYRNEGKPRKKVLESGKAVFPDLALETVINGLKALGLFRTVDDRLEPDYRRFSEFGRLSRRERMEYCAAGIACLRGTESTGSPWLLRTHLYGNAGFIHQLLNSLEPERAYPLKTLKRLVYILDITARKEVDIGVLFEAMENTGLLVSLSAKYWCLGPAAVGRGNNAVAVTAAPVIAMDAPFSMMLYPEISYKDAVALAGISVVQEAGMTVRFELSRTSAVQALNRGLSADAMIDLLKRLSLDRLDENMIWTIRDWEKRYGEVSLRRGLVLCLATERRYLAETKPLAGFITETLAPGVYLLRETAEDRAAEALRKAGVDIVARGSRNKAGESGIMNNDERAGMPGNFFLPLNNTSHHSTISRNRQSIQAGKKPAAQKPETAGTSLAASTLIKDFHSILEQMRPGKEERDELAARIDRRLVLCETQLKDAAVRYEKLEARGLDYAGKALIVKQAISLQSPVELVLPAAAGKNGERFYGIPKSLEKEGGGSVLVINPLDDSGEMSGDPLRIPLGKISLLRRIKKSIFE